MNHVIEYEPYIISITSSPKYIKFNYPFTENRNIWIFTRTHVNYENQSAQVEMDHLFTFFQYDHLRITVALKWPTGAMHRVSTRGRTRTSQFSIGRSVVKGCSTHTVHRGSPLRFVHGHERACTKSMQIPQQLSQGCAQHTNEDIDRFLFCTVVFRNLNWCTNLQMEQG